MNSQMPQRNGRLYWLNRIASMVLIVGIVAASGVLLVRFLSGGSNDHAIVTPKEMADGVSKVFCKRMATCDPQWHSKVNCDVRMSDVMMRYFIYRVFDKSQLNDCVNATTKATCTQLNAPDSPVYCGSFGPNNNVSLKAKSLEQDMDASSEEPESPPESEAAPNFDPKQIYVDKGACPFECCTYREWAVVADTTLFDTPNGSVVVGEVNKGEKIQALTGEVHIVPTPFDVVYDTKRFKVGDRAYLLTYLGEGFQKIWSKGSITVEEVWFLDNADKGCKKPTSECWGRLQGEQKSTWWVKIRMKNGKIGWTKQTENFNGQDMDSCS